MFSPLMLRRACAGFGKISTFAVSMTGMPSLFSTVRMRCTVLSQPAAVVPVRSYVKVPASYGVIWKSPRVYSCRRTAVS